MTQTVNEEKLHITKESLYGALMRLLEQKPYEEITVTELCKIAGVSRMSYYRNFSSFEDIIMSHLADRPLGFSPDIKPGDFNPLEHSRASFQYFYEERVLLSNLLNNHMQNLFVSFCQQFFTSAFRPVARSLGFTETYDLSVLTGMYCMTILDWARNNFTESVEEMAQFGALIFERFSTTFWFRRKGSASRKNRRLDSQLSKVAISLMPEKQEILYNALLKHFADPDCEFVSDAQILSETNLTNTELAHLPDLIGGIVYSHLSLQPLGQPVSLSTENFAPYDNSLESFRYLLNERTLIEGLYRTGNWYILEIFVDDYFKGAFRPIAEMRGFRQPLDIPVLCSLYTRIAEEWVSNGFRESPEEMARYAELIYKRFAVNEDKLQPAES